MKKLSPAKIVLIVFGLAIAVGWYQLHVSRFGDYVFDTLAIAWESMKHPNETAAFSASSPWVINAILKRVKPGNILELGAGPGTITIPLIERFFSASTARGCFDVVELQKNLFEKLKYKVDGLLTENKHKPLVSIYNEDFTIWNPAGAGNMDEYYDTVISTIPLTRLPQDVIEKILTRAYRFLKPGGIFIYVSLAGARTFGYCGAFFRELVTFGEHSCKNCEYLRKLAFIDQWIADGFTQEEELVWCNITPMRVYWATKKG